MNLRVLAVAGGLAALTAAGACGPRQVEVRTAPAGQAQLTLQVNNDLTQAVNVYAVTGGTSTFLRQVAAKNSVAIPLQGFAPGTTVTLRAVTIDGTHTYSRDHVVLNGTYVFPLP